MNRILIAGLVAAVALSGCARNTDSRSAGFVNGLLNQVDGTYEQQRQDLRKANEASAAQNQTLEERNAALEQERSQLEKDARFARNKLAKLRRQVATEKQRYAVNSAEYQAAARRETELTRVEQSVNESSKTGNSAQMSDALRALSRAERETN